MKRITRSKPETVKVGNVMVRIYKRDRKHSTGKIYTSHYVEDHTSGRRKWRVFADIADARREADKIARQLSTGDATAARLTNSQAASFGRATELIRPTGATLEVAASVYAKIYELVGDRGIEAATFYKQHRADQIERKRVADVVNELLALREKRTKKGRPASARYLGDLRARLTKFSESFVVDISTITKGDVQKWLDDLDAAPQTVKNYRTVLNTLFSFAQSRGYIVKGSNPVAETEQISSNGGRIQVYTPEEIKSLLKAASKEFRPLLFLGAFAGLRAAEAERVHWEHVDLKGGFIHVSAEHAKTASRRLVPITDNLRLWLADYADNKGQVWTGTIKELRTARADAVKGAKVDWKDNGLRHSFISYRIADVQNAAQVALEAGNSAKVVFRHYRELVKPEQAKAWFAIVPEVKP